MAPFTASIVFLIIWVSVYLKRSPEQDAETYKQAVIGTAFTGASFLVTAGTLILYAPLLVLLIRRLRRVDHGFGWIP